MNFEKNLACTILQMRNVKRTEVEKSIDNILDLIGLVEQKDTWAKKLSGGMKRRLSIGISLVGDSKVNKFLNTNTLSF